jgi:hypothetical protein
MTKGSNCLWKCPVVKPFCLSTDDMYYDCCQTSMVTSKRQAYLYFCGIGLFLQCLGLLLIIQVSLINWNNDIYTIIGQYCLNNTNTNLNSKDWRQLTVHLHGKQRTIEWFAVYPVLTWETEDHRMVCCILTWETEDHRMVCCILTWETEDHRMVCWRCQQETQSGSCLARSMHSPQQDPCTT